jgi:hypothetical protein
MQKNKYDIYSPYQGKVKYALKDTNSDYGKRIYIEYPMVTLMFGHLNKIFVKENDIVDAGQLIGEMGNTGYSPSLHLHVSAFLPRTKELTAKYTVDPTIHLKLAPYWVTNTLVSNPYRSKYCNPKLDFHEGIDFSGTKFIKDWDTVKIDPLRQDMLLKKDHPEFYKE